jgi:hypothetical protein
MGSAHTQAVCGGLAPGPSFLGFSGRFFAPPVLEPPGPLPLGPPGSWRPPRRPLRGPGPGFCPVGLSASSGAGPPAVPPGFSAPPVCGLSPSVVGALAPWACPALRRSAGSLAGDRSPLPFSVRVCAQPVPRRCPPWPCPVGALGPGSSSPGGFCGPVGPAFFAPPPGSFFAARWFPGRCRSVGWPFFCRLFFSVGSPPRPSRPRCPRWGLRGSAWLILWRVAPQSARAKSQIT